MDQVPETSGPPHDLARLIGALDRHCVEYLLCGGAAAVAYGSTRRTEDADCVVRREGENLDRLAAALRDLNARPCPGYCLKEDRRNGVAEGIIDTAGTARQDSDR